MAPLSPCHGDIASTTPQGVGFGACPIHLLPRCGSQGSSRDDSLWPAVSSTVPLLEGDGGPCGQPQDLAAYPAPASTQALDVSSRAQ